MKKLFATLFVLWAATAAWANFALFQVATTPSVTCVFSKNIVTDYSADNTGLSNVQTAFLSFNTDAKAANPSQVCLTIPAGSYWFAGSSGTSWTKGIKNLLVSGYGATITDHLRLATNATTAAGDNVLHFAAVPAGLTAVKANLGVGNVTSPNTIPGGTSAIALNGILSTTSTTVTLGLQGVTNASTTSSNVLHFSSVPGYNSGAPANSGIIGGSNPSIVTDVDNPGSIPGGTVVVSFTGTTVTLNNSVTVASGDTIQFTIPAQGAGIGNGDTINFVGGGFFLGAGNTGANYGDDQHYRNTATVSAGASCITTTSGDTSLWTVGDWAIMTGLDLQGYGFPQNPYFYEYVEVASINSGTNQICFTSPLQYTYKSTWPNYNAGSSGQIYMGGPATLYAIHQEWNTTQEYQGLTYAMDIAQIKNSGRYITHRDCTALGLGPIASEQYELNIINCDTTAAATMEIDKLYANMTFVGGSAHGYNFQTATAVETVTMRGHHVTSVFGGTPHKLVIQSGSQIDTGLIPGANSYGISTELDCDSSTISSGVVTGGGFGTGISAYGITMSGGVITVPRANYSPVSWAVPGKYLAFGCGPYTYCDVFQVVDVTADATNTYVTTNLAGGFPTMYTGAAVISTIGAASVTFNNCSGSDDAIDLSNPGAQGQPLWSYSKRTYTGSTPQTPVQVWGLLSSVVTTVNTAYAGSSALNFGWGGFQVFQNQNARVDWEPEINTKNPGGAHSVTVTPTTVTGTQSGDSISAPGADSWFVGSQGNTGYCYVVSHSCSVPGDIGSTSTTIEIITNQGISP